MAGTTPNLFEELKTVLTDFKTFLDQNVNTIKPAIQAIAAMFEDVKNLIDKLIELMTDLKKAIQDLNPGAIADLNKALEFVGKTTSFLTTAKGLLPDQAGTIDEIIKTAEVVSSLPSLDALKTEILSLVDAIIGHLNALKPTI